MSTPENPGGIGSDPNAAQADQGPPATPPWAGGNNQPPQSIPQPPAPAAGNWPGAPGYGPQAAGFGQPGYGQFPMPGYPQTPGAGKRPIGWIVATAVAVVVAIGAVVVGVVLSAQSSSKRDSADRAAGQLRARAAGEAAARTATCDFATTISTYDYTKLDAYLAAVQKATTGEFRQTFADAAKALQDTMTQAKTSSTLAAKHCGVESFDGDRATVLVSIAQTVTNATGVQPTQQINAIVTVEKQSDGRWLVSKMDQLNQPR
ncbi:MULTISPECIES: VirB8/TrbF family protein [unclassified Nocardia]|uniref:VirB8/TrbF family protein n=1 Tax=unclassified Nocardia TaxID=2637762 RepID=UPI001CE4A752|nr:MULTISPECIES: VirB8/TrbF family protein [unclassified Nocardia]